MKSLQPPKPSSFGGCLLVRYGRPVAEEIKMLPFIKRLIAALGLLAIVMAGYLFVARPYQLHWGATEKDDIVEPNN